MAKKKPTPMTKARAAQIQGSTAKRNGGHTPKGGFAPRAQRAADRNGSNDKG